MRKPSMRIAKFVRKTAALLCLDNLRMLIMMRFPSVLFLLFSTLNRATFGADMTNCPLLPGRIPQKI